MCVCVPRRFNGAVTSQQLNPIIRIVAPIEMKNISDHSTIQLTRYFCPDVDRHNISLSQADPGRPQSAAVQYRGIKSCDQKKVGRFAFFEVYNVASKKQSLCLNAGLD